jgi:hypothetical protein
MLHSTQTGKKYEEAFLQQLMVSLVTGFAQFILILS